MLWLKMLIGAIAVLIIQIFAQSRWYYVAALAPLFPTFTLITHFLVASQRTPAEFRVALVFSMLGVIPHLLYTLVVFYTYAHVGVYKSLAFGVIAWLVGAVALVIGWQQLQLVNGA